MGEYLGRGGVVFTIRGREELKGADGALQGGETRGELRDR